MTPENNNVPAGATNTNEDKEQILNTNSIDQYTSIHRR